jgi:hypothetical protein
MKEDIRKRDLLLRDLQKQLASPPPPEQVILQQLADTKEEIEKLKRSQESLLYSNTPDKKREKTGKWQEYLETPISVSQRRSRRETPRQTR